MDGWHEHTALVSHGLGMWISSAIILNSWTSSSSWIILCINMGIRVGWWHRCIGRGHGGGQHDGGSIGGLWAYAGAGLDNSVGEAVWDMGHIRDTARE